MTHMITASGLEYHLSGLASMQPGGRPILIDDIAHHLSLINRFTGATRRPYSVAEHSLLVSEIAQRNAFSRAVQLAALMHDAHEAYTQDVSSPAKRAINQHATQSGGTQAWTQFEQEHEREVHRHFGISTISRAYRAALVRMDLEALATERRDLTAFDAYTHQPWTVFGDAKLEPETAITPLSWVSLKTPEREAMTWKDWRLAFMDRFQELTFGLRLEAGSEVQPS